MNTITVFLGQIVAGVFLVLLFVAYVKAAKKRRETQKITQKQKKLL